MKHTTTHVSRSNPFYFVDRTHPDKAVGKEDMYKTLAIIQTNVCRTNKKDHLTGCENLCTFRSNFCPLLPRCFYVINHEPNVY